MMRTQIIQLDGYDDITSANEKLSAGRSARIVLVWPQKTHLLDSRLDLLRLQRRCRAMGAQLALVTRDGTVRSIARGLDIPVFRQVEQAERSPWRAGRRKVAPLPARRSLAAIQAAYADFHPNRSRANLPLPVRLAVFLAAVLAVLGLAVFILPSARIQLTLPTTTQRLHWQGEAYPTGQNPLPANALPIQTLEVVVEASDGMQTSGVMQVAERPASGTARFTNLTAQAVPIPLWTVLADPQDVSIRFQTAQPANAPAGVGKTVDVAIRAMRAGTAGNLPVDRLQAVEGPLGLQLAVTNPTPTSGGTDKTYPAPSDSDRETLKARLLQTLRTSALSQAKGQLPPGTLLIEASLTAGEVIADQSFPPDREPSDRLEQTLRARYRVNYLAGEDLRRAAAAALDAAIPAGFQTMVDDLQVSPTGEPTLSPDGRVTWEVDASRTIQPAVSTAEVASALRGVPVDQASAWLSGAYHLAQPAFIQMQPSFWPWLPFLTFRTVVLNP